ncbi:MAG: OmpH family outer membrane protein [Bacteroidales bacterium]
MKKIIVLIGVLLVSCAAFSQRMAYVDTEYILSKIPAYKEAQQELDNLTKEWQLEIQQQVDLLDEMYKQYQVDKVLLSKDMRAKREQKIIDKEKEVKELQRRRFGPEGDRVEKEKEFIQPIQEEVFTAVETFAEEENYAFIFDAATSSMTLLFTDSKYDMSDKVLKNLGYLK